MKFSQIYFLKTILESEDIKYIPSKDEIRKFNQVRKGNKIDYSKDFHNRVLHKFYSITIKILDEKLRKSFAEIIFKNMGNLSELISSVEHKNDMNNKHNKYKELRDYIEEIKGEIEWFTRILDHLL